MKKSKPTARVMPKPRRSSPASALTAVQSIVGKLRDMSADQAASIGWPELHAWVADEYQTNRTGLTDDQLDDRQRKIIRLAQAMRRSDGDPDQRCFYVIAWNCVSMAERAWPNDPATVDIWAKIDAIKRREGLDEDDAWQTGEGPADYRALETKSTDRYDQLVVDQMRLMGEADMAALYINDRDEFDRRFEKGRAVTHPEEVDTPGLAK